VAGAGLTELPLPESSLEPPNTLELAAAATALDSFGIAAFPDAEWWWLPG
jgi:hypothetical protein